MEVLVLTCLEAKLSEQALAVVMLQLITQKHKTILHTQTFGFVFFLVCVCVFVWFWFQNILTKMMK